MDSFMGYGRLNGSVGVRNHILIIPSVTCSSHVVREISQKVPGTISIENQYGCGQIGEDFQQTFRTFVGLGTNPNVGGVLIVGLGCELLRPEKLAGEIAASGKPVEMLLIQESGGTSKTIAKGIKAARALLRKVKKNELTRFPLDRLILGLECGGSDSTSGLAANPALGYAVDLLVKQGGAAVLTEVPEMIGAEHLLTKRALNEQLAVRLRTMVDDFEKEAISKGIDIRGTQPTPGNMAGGLTTIEEKSLGCIYKAGTSPINDVIDYSAKIKTKGVTIMNGPGHDVQSIIGMLAGGAQIIAFTTGRGTPVGAPIAPVLKITANQRAFAKMQENIDIYVGDILYKSSTLETAGQRIYEEIIEAASGKLTRSEVLKHREFGIWRVAFTI